ncbi:MAG: YybH family protein [Pyrinomonadaceae bacterium]
MKRFFIILGLLSCVTAVAAQNKSDLQSLVDTEHSFADFAAAHDTKSAFLEFLAVDGVVFQPDKLNGIAYWNARGPSKGLLSWAPNYADLSTNGMLGYTIGNWEYRPKGKDDTPIAFGDFITVWSRQADGKYKFVVDIGVGHEKPAVYSSEWVTTADKTADPNAKNMSAADTANSFCDMATKRGLRRAYETYAADDIRFYREEKLPFLGKKASIKAAKAEKGTVQLAKKSTFFGSTNLSYTTSTYTRTDAGKLLEKGNYMQIWKLKAGRWVIVLDIFKPVPDK